MVVTATAPASGIGTAAPASGWENEVFVLRGGDRGDLRDRALSLAAAVESHQVSLPSIAAGQLRKLGPSIFGVLLADQAVTRVLRNLELPVSAIAGHSAGELAALLVAGAMDSEAVLGPRLVEIMDIMQRQEDEAGGPDVALLAVGAGQAAVEEAGAT